MRVTPCVLSCGQSCLTLHDPMDCSLPGSSAHGIFQARVLEWIAVAFSSHMLHSMVKKKKDCELDYFSVDSSPKACYELNICVPLTPNSYIASKSPMLWHLEVRPWRRN